MSTCREAHNHLEGRGRSVRDRVHERRRRQAGHRRRPAQQRVLAAVDVVQRHGAHERARVLDVEQRLAAEGRPKDGQRALLALGALGADGGHLEVDAARVRVRRQVLGVVVLALELGDGDTAVGRLWRLAERVGLLEHLGRHEGLVALAAARRVGREGAVVATRRRDLGDERRAHLGQPDQVADDRDVPGDLRGERVGGGRAVQSDPLVLGVLEGGDLGGKGRLGRRARERRRDGVLGRGHLHLGSARALEPLDHGGDRAVRGTDHRGELIGGKVVAVARAVGVAHRPERVLEGPQLRGALLEHDHHGHGAVGAAGRLAPGGGGGRGVAVLEGDARAREGGREECGGEVEHWLGPLRRGRARLAMFGGVCGERNFFFWRGHNLGRSTALRRALPKSGGWVGSPSKYSAPRWLYLSNLFDEADE